MRSFSISFLKVAWRKASIPEMYNRIFLKSEVRNEGSQNIERGTNKFFFFVLVESFDVVIAFSCRLTQSECRWGSRARRSLSLVVESNALTDNAFHSASGMIL